MAQTIPACLWRISEMALAARALAATIAWDVHCDQVEGLGAVLIAALLVGHGGIELQNGALKEDVQSPEHISRERGHAQLLFDHFDVVFQVKGVAVGHHLEFRHVREALMMGGGEAGSS